MIQREQDRLDALRAFRVLDTAPEAAFDRVAALAADLFQTPIALVSLVDESRQWFKARVGLDACSTPREQAFCTHAIDLAPHSVMVVEDAALDPRFADNPLVVGPPHIRFYAGAVLSDRDGFNLGTLCIIDTKPRPRPAPAELNRLQCLARIVMDDLERARERAESDARFRLMADNAADVIMRQPAAGGFCSFISPSVEAMIGYTPADFETRTTRSFIIEEDRQAMADGLARMLAGETEVAIEFRSEHRDGHLIWAESRPRLLPEVPGAPREMVTVIRDISERKALEAELVAARDAAREQARRAALAEKLAGLGHWRLDLETRAITWSDEMYAIYGLRHGAPLEFDAILAMTHPDDKPGRAGRFAAAVEGAPPEQQYLTRIIRADGETRWLASAMNIERASDGRIVAVIGTVMDVTEQKRVEAALVENEARHRLLVDGLQNHAFYWLDPNGRVASWNAGARKLKGYVEEEIVGAPFSTFFTPEDRDAGLAEDILSCARENGWYESEGWRLRKDGSRFWASVRLDAIRAADGEIIGYAKLTHDVSARKAMEAELREARAAAEQAAQVKSEFLSNMSHELRTPLTSIIGFTELTIIRPDLPETVRGYITRVRNASKALLSLVNDILDFSKLEAGQVELRPQPTELEPFCRGVLELLAPQAAAKDLDLRLELAPCAGLFPLLDPDRLRQVLLNLVGNAVKFTEAGSVTLGAAYDAARAELRVSVSDTGSGIPEDKLDRLFKRFSQIDGGMSRAHGGTGLGLAICKGLIETMGGEIGAESSPAVGSRFWFTVRAPLAACTPAEGQAASAPAEGIAGVRVLVVDDHSANRDLARLFLSGCGAEVSEASDGEAAIQLAQTLPFDVILMDLRMPGLDGLEAFRRIRSSGGPNDQIPILAFTANASPEDAERLKGQGFEGVVCKPVDPRNLVSAVTHAANSALDGRERASHAV